MVIKKPEITKNTSTPTKPPGTSAGHRCQATTSATATARSAWISGRRPVCGQAEATRAGGEARPERASCGAMTCIGEGTSTTPRKSRASVRDVPTYPSFVEALPTTKAALEFAASRHAGQVRDTDRAPFILHPLEVAHLLQGRDYPDHVIAAGVLHDVIEDADVPYEELVERFGAEVAGLVREVSEPVAEGSYAERKARLREAVAEASADALAVFAADKVAKARELRLGLVAGGGDGALSISQEKLD